MIEGFKEINTVLDGLTKQQGVKEFEIRFYRDRVMKRLGMMINK